tara:strand:- start:4944 stop:5174 length:231 start_codon:yes stop_codon:yes gene_type:complete
MNIRRERFIKVGERRVNNALKAINLIGNLSNKANYEYSSAEIKKIEKVLKDELFSTMEKFNSSNNKNLKKGFSFQK